MSAALVDVRFSTGENPSWHPSRERQRKQILSVRYNRVFSNSLGGKQRFGDLRGIGRGEAHSRRARSLLRCAVIGVKRQKPCQDDRWIKLSEQRLEHGQIAHEIVDRGDIAEPDCGKHSQAEIDEGA